MNPGEEDIYDEDDDDEEDDNFEAHSPSFSENSNQEEAASGGSISNKMDSGDSESVRPKKRPYKRSSAREFSPIVDNGKWMKDLDYGIFIFFLNF